MERMQEKRMKQMYNAKVKGCRAEGEHDWDFVVLVRSSVGYTLSEEGAIFEIGLHVWSE